MREPCGGFEKRPRSRKLDLRLTDAPRDPEPYPKPSTLQQGAGRGGVPIEGGRVASRERHLLGGGGRALGFTALGFTALGPIALGFSALSFTAWGFTALGFTPLGLTAFGFTALGFTAFTAVACAVSLL